MRKFFKLNLIINLRLTIKIVLYNMRKVLKTQYFEILSSGTLPTRKIEYLPRRGEADALPNR